MKYSPFILLVLFAAFGCSEQGGTQPESRLGASPVSASEVSDAVSKASLFLQLATYGETIESETLMNDMTAASADSIQSFNIQRLRRFTRQNNNYTQGLGYLEGHMPKGVEIVNAVSGEFSNDLGGEAYHTGPAVVVSFRRFFEDGGAFDTDFEELGMIQENGEWVVGYVP